MAGSQCRYSQLESFSINVYMDALIQSHQITSGVLHCEMPKNPAYFRYMRQAYCEQHRRESISLKDYSPPRLLNVFSISDLVAGRR